MRAITLSLILEAFTNLSKFVSYDEQGESLARAKLTE